MAEGRGKLDTHCKVGRLGMKDEMEGLKKWKMEEDTEEQFHRRYVEWQ